MRLIRRYTLVDIGCYVDEACGLYSIDAIVTFARNHGAVIVSCEDDHVHEDTALASEFAGCEFSNEVEDEANEYMNNTYPVEGAYWCRNENGDWGLWPI